MKQALKFQDQSAVALLLVILLLTLGTFLLTA